MVRILPVLLLSGFVLFSCSERANLTSSDRLTAKIVMEGAAGIPPGDEAQLRWMELRAEVPGEGCVDSVRVDYTQGSATLRARPGEVRIVLVALDAEGFPFYEGEVVTELQEGPNSVAAPAMQHVSDPLLHHVPWTDEQLGIMVYEPRGWVREPDPPAPERMRFVRALGEPVPSLSVEARRRVNFSEGDAVEALRTLVTESGLDAQVIEGPEFYERWQGGRCVFVVDKASSTGRIRHEKYLVDHGEFRITLTWKVDEVMFANNAENIKELVRAMERETSFF